MGKIQDLYTSRVRPMLPAERLQLARLILDDLAPAEQPTGYGDNGANVDVARVCSPRLANPEQQKDFTKQIVELAPEAEL